MLNLGSYASNIGGDGDRYPQPKFANSRANHNGKSLEFAILGWDSGFCENALSFCKLSCVATQSLRH